MTSFFFTSVLFCFCSSFTGGYPCSFSLKAGLGLLGVVFMVIGKTTYDFTSAVDRRLLMKIYVYILITKLYFWLLFYRFCNLPKINWNGPFSSNDQQTRVQLCFQCFYAQYCYYCIFENKLKRFLLYYCIATSEIHFMLNSTEIIATVW